MKGNSQNMKLWIDSVQPKPEGYTHWARSVNQAKAIIENIEENNYEDEENYEEIELINLNYDLGDYAYDGGDGLRFINWLVYRMTYYPIIFHTTNFIGKIKMQQIKKRYWK
jgi:hypothetical protein